MYVEARCGSLRAVSRPTGPQLHLQNGQCPPTFPGPVGTPSPEGGPVFSFSLKLDILQRGATTQGQH